VYLEDLRAGKSFSKARNPYILNNLKDFEGNYIEALGTGIPYMISLMAEIGKPPPAFEERGEFLVIFYSSDKKNEKTKTVINTKDKEITSTELYQEERQKLAMEYVKKNGSISNREYRSLSQVSESTAMRDLEDLVVRGSLKIVGKRRTRRYTI
jgi:ATP-dependent DNA helicase RecG